MEMSRSIHQATQLAEDRVKWSNEEHWPQQEREDIVIVARPLSQVSQVK